MEVITDEFAATRTCMIGGETLFIISFIVDKDHRGQGLGKKFYDKIEAKAKENGVKCIQLIHAGDPILVDFWSVQCGFQEKSKEGNIILWEKKID